MGLPRTNAANTYPARVPGRLTLIARLGADGTAAGDGIRSFVVGTAGAPLYDFTAPDGVVHTVWRVIGADVAAFVEAFARLDALTRPDVILTSNPSSISITLIGAATKRPEQVLGMHFMNPVPLMTLVELIRGQATSDESMRTAAQLCTSLEKEGVEAELQRLLAERTDAIAAGLTLVRREYPTEIGPVDLLCRDAEGVAVAVEINRRFSAPLVNMITPLR